MRLVQGGSISIVPALSIPASLQRDLILIVTYIVVVFSILVPRLTVRRVVNRAGAAGRT